MMEDLFVQMHQMHLLLKSASKITLQPGEEKEEVLIYFEEDKWVQQYTYRMIRI